MEEVKLRDYQEEAVSKAFGMLRRYFNVLVVLSTGSGKTFCYAYITKVVSDKDKSVMVVAHRAELISQGSLSLARMGVDHQIIGPKSLERKIKQLHLKYLGKVFINPFSKVSVGSVQTIGRRLDALKRPDLLIIDEAHHAPAGMWKKVIDHFNTKHIGLTATPCRSDGVGLGNVYNDMFVGKSMRSLIDDGNLSRYIVYSTPEEFNLDEVKRVKSGESKGDYNTRDLEKQIDKPKIVGRAVQHYEKYAKGRSCLVFAVSVAHSEHIAEEFRNAGYSFIAISGATDDIERYRAVDDLRERRIDGIVNCDLFGEGTDISGVDCVIMMRPISDQAFGLFSQQVGRALRTAEGKDHAVILDMVGNFQRHGFPEDKTDWTLEDREKKKGGSGGENTIKTRTCPSCFLTHPPFNECPSCGFVYPVESTRQYEQIDGDLVKIERQLQIEENRREQNAMIRNATSAEDLAAADKALGYKAGASANKKRAIEEKKQAVSRLNTALRYWKETYMWGNIELHDELFPKLFGVTEQEARRFGTTRINRLLDNMRSTIRKMQQEAGRDYSPYEYDFSGLIEEVANDNER